MLTNQRDELTDVLHKDVHKGMRYLFTYRNLLLINKSMTTGNSVTRDTLGVRRNIHAILHANENAFDTHLKQYVSQIRIG